MTRPQRVPGEKPLYWIGSSKPDALVSGILPVLIQYFPGLSCAPTLSTNEAAGPPASRAPSRCLEKTAVLGIKTRRGRAVCVPMSKNKSKNESPSEFKSIFKKTPLFSFLLLCAAATTLRAQSQEFAYVNGVGAFTGAVPTR